MELVQAVPGGLDGLVIGYVKECMQHPNADRLRITRVDVGNGDGLQIICGASNVAAGQKVVVATVGTTVYPVNGEPFKINKSKIRGEVSEGMICAEDEIGLGTSHEGIIVLDDEAVVGTKAKDYFQLEDDHVFEIGLTPNRADAASHLGVARDLAAYLQIVVSMPGTDAFKTDDESLNIPVNVEDTEACPRYSSVTISDVMVKDSPGWLKNRLNSIGIRPINNVVDATNYVLHELGQPLHAFDADAITSGKVVVKKLKEGTLFTPLDGVERNLSADDLMICSAANGQGNMDQPLCIAGVFGGITSGVNGTTTKIFLESAWFNAVSIRKTSKRHGLKTDASFRFERGTDPDMTVTALKRAALLIKELAGGRISSAIHDHYPIEATPFDVYLWYKNTDRLIGKAIPHEEIKLILTGLGITIKSETADGLRLSVPAWKVDVTREVDIIEEILRIYGYNRIEIPAQIRASVNYADKPDKELVQNQVADLLTANGFFEILSNSLTRSDYLTNETNAVRLINPLSNDLDVMRQSMLFSGLEAISYNQKRKNADLKFYEFGKVYSLNDGKFKENQRLAIFITGLLKKESWNNAGGPVNFYFLKSTVDAILNRLHVTGLNSADVRDDNIRTGISYKRGEKTLVEYGLVAKTALRKADTAGEVLYASFDWDMVLKAIRGNQIIYKEVPKFPSVRRDLSILLDKTVTFNQLRNIAEKTERKYLKEVNVFDVYEGDKLPQGKKSYALSFILQDEEKTLTDKQIDGIMQKLIVNLEKEANVEVRK